MSCDDAASFILSKAGSHFDPDVAAAFAELRETFQFVANELTNDSMGEDAFENKEITQRIF
jgi:response regulator RpfG family c-di-GMP phosphodiesterase